MRRRALGLLAAIVFAQPLAACSSDIVPGCDTAHTLRLLDQLIETHAEDSYSAILSSSPLRLLRSRLERMTPQERATTIAICAAPDLTVRNNFIKRPGESRSACERRIAKEFDTFVLNSVEQLAAQFPADAKALGDPSALMQDVDKRIATAERHYTVSRIVEVSANPLARTASCTATVTYVVGEAGQEAHDIRYDIASPQLGKFTIAVKGLSPPL